MKQRQMRIFTENGVEYPFNNRAFRSLIDHYVKEKGIPTKGQAVSELANELYISVDAVNNWKYGKNGPADMETIKKAATYLNADWELLVKKVEGENTMTQLNERQKDAAKRIYDVVIWFLEEFNNTDGFNSWWLDLKDKGSHNPENDIMARIKQMEDRIGLVLDQEYFDLHDHEIYDEFCEFAGEDLPNLYSEKVSHAYRFESDGEGSPTVWRDFETAWQHLNEIIERYI